MGTRGQVRWKKIAEMLDVCAEGWHAKPKKHLLWVYHGGKKATLPLGEHGASRANPEIEIGHLRGLTRQFGIVDCAKAELEILR